jgi:hypothetical protein
MRHHLYDLRGKIVFSADLEGDVAEEDVTSTVFYQWIKARGSQHIQDMAFGNIAFHNFQFDNLHFTNCVFENIQFKGQTNAFSSWSLTGCRMTNGQFEGGELFRSKLEGCEFEGVDFASVYFQGGMIKCKLNEVVFGLNRGGHPPSFSNCEMKNIDFGGIAIPRIDRIYSEIYKQIASLENLKRREAMPVLYNAFTRIFEAAWTELVEIWGLSAMQWVFIANSDEIVPDWGRLQMVHLVEAIKERAIREGLQLPH